MDRISINSFNGWDWYAQYGLFFGQSLFLIIYPLLKTNDLYSYCPFFYHAIHQHVRCGDSARHVSRHVQLRRFRHGTSSQKLDPSIRTFQGNFLSTNLSSDESKYRITHQKVVFRYLLLLDHITSHKFGRPSINLTRRHHGYLGRGSTPGRHCEGHRRAED